MIKTYYIYLILSIVSFSCKKTDTIENKALSPIWERDFNVGYTPSVNPILYRDMVIYSQYEKQTNDLSSSSKFVSYDNLKGNQNWEWINTYKPTYQSLYSGDSYCLLNGTIYFAIGSRHYSISANDGTSNWMKMFGDYGEKYLKNIDNNLFSSIGFDNESSNQLIKIKTNGEFDKVLQVPFNDSTEVIGYDFKIIDDLVYFAMVEARTSENNIVYPYNLIFNLKTDSVELTTQVFEAGWLSSIEQFDIYNQEILLSSVAGHFVGVSAETGEKLWTVPLNGNTTFGGFITDDNSVAYVNTEFGLYAININSGNVLWQLEGDRQNTSSRMQLHKGVIYYTAGGLLYGVDATNGEILMSLEAPSFKNDQGAFFQPALTIDHENDRIYTASYTHAYCYPTLR